MEIHSLPRIATRLIQAPWFRWGIFLICLAGVLYGNLRPTPPEQIFQHSDKAGHSISFVFLALSARLAMYRLSSCLLWPSLFGFAYILEYLQGITRPLRHFSVADVNANVLGVLVAFILILVCRRIAPDLLPGS